LKSKSIGAVWAQEEWTENMDLAEQVRSTSAARYSLPAHVSFKTRDSGTLVDAGIADDARQTILYLARTIRDEFIQPAIQMATTRAEYVAFWDRSWTDYVRTAQALGVCIEHAMSADKALSFGERSVDELNAELKKTVVDLAGEKGRDELDFAVSTMKRAFRLISRFRSMPDPRDRKKDSELAARFSIASAIHSMAALSILAVGGGVRPNSGDVVAQMFEYLRGGALDAYAIAREAINLREPVVDPTAEIPSGFFDSDDAQLTDVTIEDAAELLSNCRRAE
jgi:hypothetical protein